MYWPHREQAHSHRGSPVNAGFVHDTDQLWELGLPAIAVDLPAKMLNALAPSRASSLPQEICGRHGDFVGNKKRP
ncbi:hypothetical protein CS078_02905 [Pseudomonas prosekii]|uniref:Uncharacterized protein n=1 Tax=Pseudomonas prosekii TaxID=1148509 RepID=A0A3L8CI02_9PSED|nr:hypothetical protein CS076_17665 [Pseudomonas prosekii]RLU12671.1 hypothetical protein CS078_02905 [Pseudomonas prosekii]